MNHLPVARPVRRSPSMWLVVLLAAWWPGVSAMAASGGMAPDGGHVLGLLIAVGLGWTALRYKRRAEIFLAENETLRRAAARRDEELTALKKELGEMMDTDQLTGLGNRRFLASVMGRDVVRICREYTDWLEGRRFAPVNTDVVFMLLRLNKAAPDDQVLLHVKDLMRRVVRDTDLLVRWEAHTFLAVFRQANRDSGPFLAERLMAALTGPSARRPDLDSRALSANIGFSCYPFLRRSPETVTWQQVIEVAALALDRAKAQGSHRWVGLYSNKKSIEFEPVIDHVLGKTDEMEAGGALQTYQSSP